MLENESPAAETAEPLPPDPAGSEDDGYGAVYDRLVTQNGADRGVDGKFTANGTADGGTDTGKPPVDEMSPSGEDAPPAAPSVPAAPAHLPNAVKAAWEKMDAEFRKSLASYTAEQDKKFGDLGRQIAAAKPFHDVAAKFGDYFDPQRGGRYQPAQAFEFMMNVQRSLDQRPVETLLEIADRFGARDGLAKALGVHGTQEGSQSLVSELRAQIAELTDKLHSFASPDAIGGYVSRTLEARDAEKVVKDFAASKEFYGDVEAYIPNFVPMAREMAGEGASTADVLERAYDMAVNALPEIREKVRAAEASKAAAKPDPARSAGARKASSINVKSNGSGNGRNLSEEELMASAYDRAMAS